MSFPLQFSIQKVLIPGEEMCCADLRVTQVSRPNRITCWADVPQASGSANNLSE